MKSLFFFLPLTLALATQASDFTESLWSKVVFRTINSRFSLECDERALYLKNNRCHQAMDHFLTLEESLPLGVKKVIFSNATRFDISKDIVRIDALTLPLPSLETLLPHFERAKKLRTLRLWYAIDEVFCGSSSEGTQITHAECLQGLDTLLSVQDLGPDLKDVIESDLISLTISINRTANPFLSFDVHGKTLGHLRLGFNDSKEDMVKHITEWAKTRKALVDAYDSKLSIHCGGDWAQAQTESELKALTARCRAFLPKITSKRCSFPENLTAINLSASGEIRVIEEVGGQSDFGKKDGPIDFPFSFSNFNMKYGFHNLCSLANGE